MEALDLCRRAVELYRGPYLEDVYSDWSLSLQEKLQGRYLQALARLARYHAACDEPREVLAYYERALAVDNAQEELHLEVMKLLVSLGEREAARQHYLTYSHWLERGMGEQPGAPLRRLHETLLGAGNAPIQPAGSRGSRP